ncbi:MAG: hypothetical protein ACHREM_08630 [Polyangiales bacterium]
MGADAAAKVKRWLDGPRPWRWAGLLALLALLSSMDLGLLTDDHMLRANLTRDARITKWGLVVYLGVERFTLDPNGKDVSITREERYPPGPTWHPVRGENRAEVDASGSRATYWFTLFGASMVQTGEIVDSGVRIMQLTAWSSADLLLRRY